VNLDAVGRAVDLGLCFDLDGVLWNTWDAHSRAFAEICAAEGLRALPYETLAGRTTVDAWRMILEANQRALDGDWIGRLTAEKQQLARRRLECHPPLYDDVGILDGLAGAPVATALISGSSAATVRIFLDAVAPIHRFDVVITAESVVRGKPAPDPYTQAARVLALEPSRCWVLEDSTSGLQSGLAAGMRTVHLVRRGGCGLEHEAAAGCVHDLAGFFAVAGIGDRVQSAEVR